jgi:hypothetical protein
MRLLDELARAKFLAIAKQNAIINEFFSAGPLESHDEVIDGEISLMLLVHINHYSTFIHHNQVVWYSTHRADCGGAM